MLYEPKVACPRGHMTCTLEEGASQGMRCHRCGATLTVLDGEWLLETLNPGLSSDRAPLTASEKPRVAELQLPAHNEIDEEAVGQFITSLPLPLSLEILGAGERRVKLVGGDESDLRFLAGKFQSLWPSAALWILEQGPVEAKGWGGGVSRFDIAFDLEEAPYLPIRTWVSFRYGDPVHTLLATTLGLLPQERVWLQFLLARKGEPPWLRATQRRLKLEAQRGYTVNADGLTASAMPGFSHVPMPESLSPAEGGVFLAAILVALVAALFAAQEA